MTGLGLAFDGLPVMRAEALSVSYGTGQGRVRAVDNVDISVSAGEVVGLVGESGCGKTSLSRALVGLTAHAGTIHLDKTSIGAQRSITQRRAIQMVFQDPYASLNPRMTVAQTLAELIRVHRLRPRDQVAGRVGELLDMVELPSRAGQARPRALSGGQRQRVAIARALAVEPRVLIADEPVSALDVSVQAAILALVRGLADDLNLAVLFISHNLAVVRSLCDRTAVMYAGRIVESAPTTDLFDQPQHPYTSALLSAVPRLLGQRTGVALAGDPPNPAARAPGCRFAARCPQRREICSRIDPGLVTIRDIPAVIAGPQAHAAACLYAWTNVGHTDDHVATP